MTCTVMLIVSGFMFQHLESVIKSRIPSLQSMINKTIIDLETELSRIGRPIATDAGVSSLIYLFLVCFNESYRGYKILR